MKLTSFALWMASTQLIWAQPAATYSWIKDRQPYQLTAEEKNYPEYVLNYQNQTTYEWQDNQLVMYSTEHRITRVTNSETIERNNRIYISMSDVAEIVAVKARSISADGRVVNFDESNLKEIKDDEYGNGYKIFAIEGVESGSEIEYFYTLKMQGKVFSTLYLQFDTPLKEYGFKLACPKSLRFEFKTYGDDTSVASDTLNGQNVYHLELHDIPGLPREGFSYFNACRKRLEYKLAFNFSSTDARINTWATAAKSFYRQLSATDKDTDKALSRFYSTLHDTKDQPQDVRIRNIEDRIKRTIKYEEQTSDAALNEIKTILKVKKASGQGMTKLLLRTYEHFGIPVQPVITCNREQSKFDPLFDSWSYLDQYLLYFPDIKSFISPTSPELRFPLIPPQYAANDGLFIEPITISGVSSALAFIHYIPALPYTADKDDLIIKVHFNAQLDENQVELKRTFLGYQAAYLLQYYEVMNDQEKDQFIESIFRRDYPDIKIDKKEISTGMDGNLPFFKINLSFNTGHFIEHAGNKVLFKVGMLIGQQSELYRDEDRVTDVENANNRGYDRHIEVELPTGYQANNLPALQIKESYTDEKSTPFQFVSDYETKDSLITINIAEYYKEVYAPQERYEDFRKVINAAADFNKVTLVISPN